MRLRFLLGLLGVLAAFPVAAQEYYGPGGGAGGGGMTPNASNAALPSAAQNLGFASNASQQVLTGPHTVADSERSSAFSLGGSSFYALTFNAAGTYTSSFTANIANTDTTRWKKIVAPGIVNNVGFCMLPPGQSTSISIVNGAWSLTCPKRQVFSQNATTVTPLFVDPTNGTDTYGSADGGGGAEITGTTSGNTLIVSSTTAGSVAIGQNFYGLGIGAGVTITAGSGSSWTFSGSAASLSAETATLGGTVTASYVNGSATNGATSVATAAGSPTLTFASGPTGCAAGQAVLDISSQGVIPDGTTVLSVNSGAHTITMSANAAGAGVGKGDVISCGDIVSVSFTSGGTTTVSAYARVGDTLQKLAGRLTAAIKGNATLQGAGFVAYDADSTGADTAVVSINPVAGYTYGQSTNSGATETVTLAASQPRPFSLRDATDFKSAQAALAFAHDHIDNSGMNGESQFVAYEAANQTDTQLIHQSPHDQVGCQGGACRSIFGPPDGSAIIQSSSGSGTIQTYYAMVLQLGNLTIQGAQGTGDCLNPQDHSRILVVGNVTFSGCAGAGVNMQRTAIVEFDGSNYLTGTTGYFINASGESYLWWLGNVFYTGAVTYTVPAVSLLTSTGATIDLNSGGFLANGQTVTGGRCQGNTNSSINTPYNPSTYLAGTTSCVFNTSSASSVSGAGGNAWVSPGAAGSQFSTGYTSTNSISILDNDTLQSSITSAFSGWANQVTFNPSGASLGTAYGALLQPQITGSVNIGVFDGIGVQPQVLAGYSGTMPNPMAGVHILNPTISNSGFATTYDAIRFDAITNGNGETSGTASNAGIDLSTAISAAAGSGGTINNRAVYISVPSGSAAGTHNWAIRIINNGGASATENWAIDDTSTAPVRFVGHVSTGATAPTLTSCGTSPTIAGSDTAGLVTMGTSATGCVITFATQYASAPYCTVTWIATPLASQSYSVSNTAITTVQTSTSNNKLYYNCIAANGA